MGFHPTQSVGNALNSFVEDVEAWADGLGRSCPNILARCDEAHCPPLSGPLIARGQPPGRSCPPLATCSLRRAGPREPWREDALEAKQDDAVGGMLRGGCSRVLSGW